MYYRAIISFADLQDNRYTYNAGDIFPRAGLTVDKARLDELAGSNNRMGKPLIKAYEPVKPREIKQDVELQNEENGESKTEKKRKTPVKG